MYAKNIKQSAKRKNHTKLSAKRDDRECTRHAGRFFFLLNVSEKWQFMATILYRSYKVSQR